MNNFTNNIAKNKIDSMLNNITVVVNEINDEVKNILLNIVTYFSGPQLQVAYA